MLDKSLLLIYLTVLLILGLSRKTTAASDSYLLMGRRLTLPFFVATLVSTWYGGIFGIGEFTYKYGLSNWVVFGLPYYFFAFIFASFFIHRARAKPYRSIPDILREAYGHKSATVGALFVLLLTSPAPYVLAVGLALHAFTPLSLTVSIVVGTLLASVYLFTGGMAAVVYTDVFQFILMFLGFAVMLGGAIIEAGPPSVLFSQLPSSHLNPTGGLPFGVLLVWFFIASWTLVDPGFYQRVHAAKDARTAKRGIYLSIFFWFVFDLITTTVGLYAVLLLPDQSQPGQIYLTLGERILPVGLKGLFYISLLATIMSTLDSNAFLSAMTIGYDLFRTIPGLKEMDVRKRSRIGLVITLVFSLWLALSLRSIVKLWYTLGTLALPALLLPVISALFPSLRIPRNWIPIHIPAAFLVSLTWLLVAKEPGGGYLWGLEPFYPGMIFSLLFWTVGILKNRKDLPYETVG